MDITKRRLRQSIVAAGILIGMVLSSTAAAPCGTKAPYARPEQSARQTGDALPAGVTPGFGFMALFSATGHGPDLNAFKRDIDTIAANGQKWVRMGIVGWEVMGVWGDREIYWSEEALRKYDEAIDYAKAKGLLIYLVLADADNNPDTALSDYKATVKEYWEVMARRYARKVAVWQVYNESDTSHFRLLTEPVRTLTASYLRDLASMLGIARAAVKAVNPEVLVTTTSTGWPMSDATQNRWQRYFDGIHAQLDVISLNVYPADRFSEIQKLPVRIADAERRYKKPVIVSEVGLQVAGKWDEEDQRLFVPAAIAAAKKVKPLAIIVYQLRDEGNNSFGLLHDNWAPRPGFPAAISVMKY